MDLSLPGKVPNHEASGLNGRKVILLLLHINSTSYVYRVILFHRVKATYLRCKQHIFTKALLW